jgi:exonuclease III
MWKFLVLTVLVALGVGGWYACQHYEIRGWDQLRLTPRDGRSPAVATTTASAVASSPSSPSADPQHESIRIASFNLGGLDEAKLGDARVREVLVQLLPRFDLIALQNIRAANQGVLVRLVEQINAAQRQYDFAVAADVHLKGAEQYSAFLLDRATVEVDRTQVYLVEDAAGRFQRKPLVGAFRARGPNPAEAFTFTLVNVDLEADRAAAEGDALAAVYRAVRDDGRGEDDIIILGTVNVGDQDLAHLEQTMEIARSISGVPTTTRGTAVADNILFNRRATTEFTGRSGVVDLIREFGLTMPEALEVSEHLPVWSEFSVFEGGQPGQVAAPAERAH